MALHALVAWVTWVCFKAAQRLKLKVLGFSLAKLKKYQECLDSLSNCQTCSLSNRTLLKKLQFQGFSRILLVKLKIQVCYRRLST